MGSPKGLDKHFGPAILHCSKDLLIDVMTSCTAGVLLRNTWAFLSFQISQVVNMTRDRAAFLSLGAARRIRNLIAPVDETCSPRCGRREAQPCHEDSDVQICLEKAQFQNKCTELSRFLTQSAQK